MPLPTPLLTNEMDNFPQMREKICVTIIVNGHRKHLFHSLVIQAKSGTVSGKPETRGMTTYIKPTSSPGRFSLALGQPRPQGAFPWLGANLVPRALFPGLGPTSSPGRFSLALGQPRSQGAFLWLGGRPQSQGKAP